MNVRKKRNIQSPERTSYWNTDEERPRIITKPREEQYEEPQPQISYREPPPQDRNAGILLDALAAMTEPCPDKVQVNIRMDADIVDWLDSLGGSRSGRINQALRILMSLG